MYFVAILEDREDGLALRLETRPVHLEWMKTVPIRIAGPLLDAKGENPVGSLLVVEAEDEAAARAILAGDPYAKAGLFRSLEVKPWRWVVGKPD
jgi:uncharacterized protein